ncbi:MAG: class I SAM-dependent methyltransferase [bacterium]|nr:class I SAM-dependent methyltransferase [bacterium]
MSYYSEIEYKKKKTDELWFEKLYFDRWFKNCSGPILDIGCSAGNFLAVAPEIIEGIDLDDEALEIALARGLKVKKVDIESGMKNIENEYYAAIYAKHVLEHLDKPLEFLREIKRILKPGGRAIISTPNCPYMLNKNFWDDYTHKRPFTRQSLKMIAFDAGWFRIKIYEDFRCFPGLGKIMRWFSLSPKLVRDTQSFFGVNGLSLILELKK